MKIELADECLTNRLAKNTIKCFASNREKQLALRFLFFQKAQIQNVLAESAFKIFNL